MAESTVYQATTYAPVNIAVVKYWGKRQEHRYMMRNSQANFNRCRDSKLNLPTNSSLSVTLNQDD